MLRPMKSYRGIRKTPTGSYQAFIRWEKKPRYIGTARDPETAAIFRDRVARHLGCPEYMLNFPERRLQGLSFERARELMRRKQGRGKSSRHTGVCKIRDSSMWAAQIGGCDNRMHLGRWPTERAAAIAHDRAVLYYESGELRNFPSMDLEPANSEQLIREARQRNARRASSRYTGTFLQRGANSPRPWAAQLQVGKNVYSLGQWATEEQAAIAYDRGALHYLGDGSFLNFPRKARRLGGLPEEELQRWATHERKKKTTSRYIGVHLSFDKWAACVGSAGETIHVGRFDSEEEAAIERDRVALRVHGAKARLNFDPTTGEEIRGRPVKVR